MTGHFDRNGTGDWHTHDEREACPIYPEEVHRAAAFFLANDGEEVIVYGDDMVLEVTSRLIGLSTPYIVEPLPDGYWLIVYKPEVARFIPTIIREAEEDVEARR